MARAPVSYRPLIEKIFSDHYRQGTTEFEFERKELKEAAEELGKV